MMTDKREHFPFEIVQFAPCSSNMSVSSSYGVFSSQVLRFFRICNDRLQFELRVNKIFEVFVKQGYKDSKLRSIFSKISFKHRFHDKFGDGIHSSSKRYPQ